MGERGLQHLYGGYRQRSVAVAGLSLAAAIVGRKGFYGANVDVG
jgi:hypothetical protein